MMRAILLVLLILIAHGEAPAATVLVPSEYGTIQEAIDAIAPGDTVQIENGAYTGAGNRDLDFHGKAIVVESASGDPDSCVIDCQGTALEPHRGFWFHSAEDSFSVLRGMTITGGYIDSCGAGILCQQDTLGIGSAPVIDNCILTDNTAADGAGIAILQPGSTARLRRCRIIGNVGSGALWGHNVDGSEATQCRFGLNQGSGAYVTGTWTGFSTGILFHDCDFDSNDTEGIRHEPAFGNSHVTASRINDNGTWGVVSLASEDGGINLSGCTITGNASGGARLGWTLATVNNCDVLDNGGPGISTSTLPYFLDISDCTIRFNDGHGIFFGWEIPKSRKPPLEIARQNGGFSGCDISFNGQRGIHFEEPLPTPFEISDCTVIGNGSDGILLASFNARQGKIDLDGNTVAYNLGDGIVYQTDMPCSLSSTIVAFNAGGSLQTVNTDSLDITCSDFYGNAAGDWTGSLMAYDGLFDNFRANPLFCSPPDTVYSLAANSPCLPGNHPTGAGCDLVGALGQGCDAISYGATAVAITPETPLYVHPNQVVPLQVTLRDSAGAVVPDQGVPPDLSVQPGVGSLTPLSLQTDPAWTWQSDYTAGSSLGTDWVLAHDPEATVADKDTLQIDITDTAIITSVADIPDDQGRQVRVVWAYDLNDTLAAPTPITQYVVWRRVDDPKRSREREIVAIPDLDWISKRGILEQDVPLLLCQGALWEPVGPVVPAMMWTDYASVVPTLRDSTSQGIQYSVFQISAHTANPQVFFISPPDSGYSMDNLIPSAPQWFTVAYGGNGNQLSWLDIPDADFQYFVVYGDSLDENFVPGPGNLIQVTVQPSWLHAANHPWNWHYKITAVDFAGNESEVTVPVSVTGVRGDGSVPRNRLSPCAPNPFNPSTIIRFETAAPGRVAVRIFDLRGRCVRTLMDESRPAGPHSLTWLGRTDRGAQAPSGVYFCRLEAPGFAKTIKMTLVQ